jgi:hypothetical protein
MHRLFLATLLTSFIFCTSIQAQTVNSANLLKQLLDLPAPPPVNPGESPTKPKTERTPEFYDSKNVPPDDAPIEDLLDYWQRQNSMYDEFRYNQTPSKESLQKILGAIENDHSLLPNYLSLLPADPEIADVVKRIYETERQAETPLPGWLNSVKSWLRQNSDLFLSELIEGAKSIKGERGVIENQAELIALAKVDWESAKPIVESFENNRAESETYVLAKYVLYHHALQTKNETETERYRDELKKLVEDKTGSYKTRDLAMDALVLGGPFEGREEWYMSLLEDETLLELQENGYTGLTTLIRFIPNEREKWMASMLRLLDSGKPNLRSVGVRNLYQIAGFGQKEIVRKLLPWLTNPDWAKESGDHERMLLIEALGELDLPESVPGLIAVVSDESDDYRAEAAKSLIKYKSPEAVPVLRRLLASENNYEFRESLIEAILAANGFSVEEQISALESYAGFIVAKKKEDSTKNEEPDIFGSVDEKPFPVDISLGLYLKNDANPSDGLALRTIGRIKVLQKTKPEIAAILLEILQNWENPLIDLEMLGWMNSGKANVGLVLKLLTKRSEMGERIPNELLLWRGKSAVLRAFCSLVLQDKNDFSAILREADPETGAALLALARLVRTPLPVREVAVLLKNANKMLALSAERYLESEDSLEARTIILAENKGKARILGAQQGFVPDEKANFEKYQGLLNYLFREASSVNYLNLDLGEINKAEKNLRDEFTANGKLLAIYGFVENVRPSNKILRVYDDKIVFTFYEDEARYWTKTITPKEYETLLNYIVAKKIDNFAPFDNGYERDVSAGEFVMFGRDGGRRIFYHGYAIPPQLEDLAKFFDSFNEGERQLHYRLAEKLSGLQVLLADPNFAARTVWKNGADLRVLVEDKTEQKTILEDLEKQEKLEDTGGSQNYQLRRERRAAAAYKHFSWRNFLGGKLGEARIEQPAEIKYLGEMRKGFAVSDRFALALEPHSFQRQAADFEIQSQPVYGGELVKINNSGATTVLKEGMYANPVLTPDGKWIIAAKSDNNFYIPNYVVRINMINGSESRINIAPADDFFPVAYLPAQNKVLLYRGKDKENREVKNNPSPEVPEYYLFDQATGAVQLVKGEFRPLEEQTFRGLQPTITPNVFWAAIYDEKLKTTQIGYYNAIDFTFKAVMQLPEIGLDSMRMWVDEKEAKIYFVYSGHLLAVPLQTPQK